MKKKKSVASQPETTQEEKSRPLKPAIEYFCTGKLLFWNLGNFHSISSLLRFSSNLCSIVSLLFVKGKRVESVQDSFERNLKGAPPRRKKMLVLHWNFFRYCSPFFSRKIFKHFSTDPFFEQTQGIIHVSNR
jgi:hypothetical protein